MKGNTMTRKFKVLNLQKMPASPNRKDYTQGIEVKDPDNGDQFWINFRAPIQAGWEKRQVAILPIYLRRGSAITIELNPEDEDDFLSVPIVSTRLTKTKRGAK